MQTVYKSHIHLNLGLIRYQSEKPFKLHDEEICLQAGLSTEFTNHSLRAYGATSLFQVKVPEKLIQQCTGHKNLKALRHYECTSNCQLLDVSNIAFNFCDINETSSVSVKSTLSVSMPLSTVTESSRCTMYNCGWSIFANSCVTV